MGWYSEALFTWLGELADHNDRGWFQEHKSEYEALVKRASADFITAIAPGMAAISPHIRCDERALFRIYRDTRFAKDKTPYKTHVGLHFRHASAGDAHAPGFYLHMEPSGCWFGCGIWQPDPATLARLRKRILDDGEGWSALMASVGGLGFDEDSLKRPPRGVPEDHPHVRDLKRRSFVRTTPIPRPVITGDGLVEAWLGLCEANAPLMADLCQTLDLAW